MALSRLLLETGDALLQESSGFILLDDDNSGIVSVRLDFGLGGHWLDVLTNSAKVVSVWPFRQLAATSLLIDRANRRNHGAYEDADGFTRGAPMGFPGGGLGVTFDGVGTIVVADDGAAGYKASGDTVPRTLSLAGGDMDIVVILSTSRNDTTRRAIAQKMATNASGDGWSVALLNGRIEFTLRKSGSQVFRFARGTVDDGEIHTVHCIYRPADGEARIDIDGSQSGAAVSGLTGTPSYVASDLIFGAFADGSGDLADTTLFAAMVGSAGDTSLSQALEASRVWTDVTADLRAQPILLETGIASGLDQHQAGVGTLSWVLDNGLRVTQSLYTIGHANVRSGFRLGLPVRLRLGTDVGGEYVWPMRLAAADPEPGTYRGKRVLCQAVDWFESAARSSVTEVAVQVDETSDEAWVALVDEVDEIPVSVSRETGLSEFPFALDSLQGGTVLEAMARVMGSESGYCFMRNDALVFHSRVHRQVPPAAALTLNNSMNEMAVEISRAQLVNVIYATIHPRVAGTQNDDTLWELSTRDQMLSGETRTYEGQYRDPDLHTSEIGGTDFLDPVAGTDYSLSLNADGTGDDYTPSLSVSVRQGGSGVSFLVTNTGALPGYLYLRQRGRVLRTDESTTIVSRDDESIRRHGPRKLDRTYAFLSDVPTVRALTDQTLLRFRQGVSVPSSIAVKASKDPLLVDAILSAGIGEHVDINEPVSAIAGGYWVHGTRLEIVPPGWVNAELNVFPSLAGQNIWILGVVGRSELGSCYVGV